MPPRAARRDTLAALARDIVGCDTCPRLIGWCRQVAQEKRRAYRDQDYWGRPVPGFGDARARLVIVGLAPGAHGANRTGRMFTGDGSGDFLYGALHRAGLASQPASTHRDDGLRLDGVFITNAARCAPPGNHPTTDELARCAPFLDRELRLLRPRVLLALGAIAWDASLSALERLGLDVPRPRPKFAHAAAFTPAEGPLLLGSFHVSRQNTNTGRLNPAMFDAVLVRAKRALASASKP